MKTIITIISLAILGGYNLMAIEEAPYTTVKKDKNVEIRDYKSYILAETVVEASVEDAGNKAFRKLFKYISGDNKSKTEVAMTAPVSQKDAGEKIAMTAPVSQQAAEKQQAVSFMMPASYTMKTIPTPTDDTIKIREVPARRVAAIRYSGRWTEKRYLKFKKELEAWIAKEQLTVAGEAVWARYNPPFTLWFLRRNEVLIPVEKREEVDHD